MPQTDHERERKFQIQLRIQIPDSCSEDTLHKSLKKKLVSSFSNAPFFQVNVPGLATQIWILDAKLDGNGRIIRNINFNNMRPCLTMILRLQRSSNSAISVILACSMFNDVPSKSEGRKASLTTTLSSTRLNRLFRDFLITFKTLRKVMSPNIVSKCL